MSADNARPRLNTAQQVARRVHQTLGFQKGYNFVLWFIFGGALFGFSLSRLKFLDFNGQFCPTVLNADTGPAISCYWVAIPRYRIGTLLHLATVLPAGLLAVFQFVPAIRHRFLLYHRLAGYVIVLLMTLGNIGAIMIADRSLAGDLPTQTLVGVVSMGTTITFALALYNIKMMQIDQHRAWMLRTWFYVSFIVTLRIIQILMALIISMWPYETLWTAMTCEELSFLYRNHTTVNTQYPDCRAGDTALIADGHVAVKAHYGDDTGQTMAAFNVSFAAAGFLALVLHALGIEIYLKMTPREANRLRQISYEKQCSRSFKFPGSSGLVAERLGDADPWYPKEEPS